MTAVRVQAEDFDLGAELAALQDAAGEGCGALASFLGVVRATGGITGLTLEHYPGMTERELTRLAVEAEARWAPIQVRIVHRYGTLSIGDRIVLAAAASPHRAAAFDACAFLMDRLKTEAPFWKCEHRADGSRWVAARDQDTAAADRWATVQPPVVPALKPAMPSGSRT